jgi:uncharacterized protein DUF6941
MAFSRLCPVRGSGVGWSCCSYLETRKRRANGLRALQGGVEGVNCRGEPGEAGALAWVSIDERRGSTFDILGLIEHVTAPKFPLTMPRLTFVVFVEASTMEGADHTIASRPINEDFQMEIGYAEERTRMPQTAEGYPYRAAVQFLLRATFARPGEPGIQVLADGNRIGEASMLVTPRV